MDGERCEDYCIAVGRVPKVLSKEKVSNCIEQLSNTSVEKWTIIEGAENDRNYERLLLKLNSKLGVQRLYEDLKQEEIEHKGEYFTIVFEKCIGCEIPLEWEFDDLEMDGDPDPDGAPPRAPNRGNQPPNVSAHQGGYPANLPHIVHQMNSELQSGTFYQNYPPTSQPSTGQGYNPQDQAPGQSSQGQAPPNLPGFNPNMPGFPHFPFPMVPPNQQPSQGQTAQQPFVMIDPQMLQGMMQQFPAGMFPMAPGQPFPGQPREDKGDPPPYTSGGDHMMPTQMPTPQEPESITKLKGPATNQAIADQEEHFRKLQKKGQREEQSKYENPSLEEEEDHTSNQKTTKLVVKDLPRDAHGDFIQLYFEKLGKHDVVKIEMDEALSMALIEFGEPEAVDRVLQMDSVNMRGSALRVKPYFEPEEDEEPLCIVEVHGLNGIEMQTVEMYFESKRRAGGDEIVAMDYEEEETAFITYQSEDIAKRVVERGNHTINKQALVVTLWQPPPKNCWNVRTPESEPELEPADTIEVFGIDDTIDSCTLEMYFENTKRSGGDEIRGLDVQGNVAYITYFSPEVAQRVVDKGQHSLNRKTLEVKLWRPVRHSGGSPDQPATPEPVCTIEVYGIHDSIDEQTLEMYFENTKRSGGGDIEDYSVDYNEGIASITFKEEGVAERVVAKADHVLNKRPLQVVLSTPTSSYEEVPAPEPLCTVEVQGISPSIDQETLEMYFENKKRSGGGDISNLDLNEQEGIAYIKYETEEVAQRVVEKGNHVLNRRPLTVTIHQPQTQKPTPRKRNNAEKSDASLDSMKSDDGKQKPTEVVKVKGIKRVTSLETMRYYFENKRRSGGGDIQNFEKHDEDDDIVFITFGAHEVAKEVAKREHSVENQPLEVSLYTPPKPRPFFEDKILIRGLKGTTTKDCLFNFLEAKSGSVPIEILRGEKEGVVLITFDCIPAFTKLVEVCGRTPLEGGHLEVSRVQVTNCIIVLNLPEHTTKDTIWFYFENSRRSNGGPIDKVFMKEEDATCLVYFMDYKVVDKVVAKTHKIGNNTVIVNMFLECLGRPQGDGTEAPLKIPDAIVITDLETKKVKFMTNSKVNLDAITRQMEAVYADLIWPEKETKIKNVVIKCTLTKETKDVRSLAKSWRQTAMSNFNDFMKNIVIETCSVHPELWNLVIDKLNSIQVKSPDAVAILADRDQGGIATVGVKQIAEGVSKDIAATVRQIEEELKKEKEKTRETLTNLKLIETKMLLAEKFPNQMEAKYPGLKVKINQNKNEIVFDGMAGDITKAKLDMFHHKDGYAVQSTDMTGCRSKFSLYDSKPAKDYIVRRLKSSHVTAVWEVKDQRLHVCCNGEHHLDTSMDLVKNGIVEHSVSLTGENINVVKSESWQAMLEEQSQKYPGKIAVEVQGSVAFVCGTDDVVNDVLGVVKKFLRTNTIIEEHVNFNTNINRLIEKDHKEDIANISKKYASLNTQCNAKSNNAGFILRGTSEGVEHMKSELHALKSKVITRDHTLESPGIAAHMQGKGQEHINTVEQRYAVVIDSPEDDDSDGNYELVAGSHERGPRLHAECTAYDDRKIYTAEGDMTELDVDVLVNTADSKLSLTGGLGKAIISKGGKAIESACRDYIQNEGELGEGEAFISTAGNLPVKYIVHIVGPVWKGGTHNEEALLAESVLKSMKQATVKLVTSIALPAISCGVYGFPVKRATKVIVQSVKNFFREIQDSTITSVYLCDVKMNTVEGFTEALTNEFGKRNVREIPRKQVAARPKAAPRKPRISSMPTRKKSPENSSDEDAGPQTLPASRHQGVRIGNMSVTVVKGEIGKQRVDVIVNTTARNLDLSNGAVSASLLRAAGSKLQQEVSSKYPNGIKDGEIAVTSGQSLKCQRIIHTSLMNWDGKSSEAKRALHTLMNNCLNEACTNNFRSIAFPAIGTGNLGFPRDVVAREMFTVISNFSKKNPSSNITDVRFIVYEKDLGTISAFAAEEKRWQSGSGPQRNRQTRQLDQPFFKVVQQSDSESDDTDGSGPYEDVGSGGEEEGGNQALSIKVYKGDITKVNCDCIVNSSNDSLDLSKGAVSQALMKIGGQELRAECRSKARAMKADGIVLTKAPGLPFKYILHVVAQDSTRSWKRMVDRCFQMAEGNKIRSIAFPALGTNIQANPTEIAEVLVNSLREFEAKPHHYLQEVEFVIFKTEMVDIFKKALENTTKPKKGFLESMITGITAAARTSLSFGMTDPPKKPKKKQKKAKSPSPMERPDQFPIRIYSLDSKAIDDAIQNLEDIIKNEVQKQIFKDPLLKNLHESQKKQIKALEKDFGVQIKFKGGADIEVTGMVQNVMEANNKIHSVIRELDRMEQQKSEARRVSQMVQWFFIDITEVKQELVPYESPVNMLIENAFNNQQPKVAFSDSEGKKYIIDFAKMHEYPEGDADDCVNVIRRDLMKQGSFNTPTYWTDMVGAENLKVVTLQNTDQEFQDIVKQFTVSVNSPNYEVTRIDRIQNKTLWMQYHAKKKLLDDTNKSAKNESMLWHGTTVESVDSINANGFNRSYCGKNATAFGDGVYFAVNASYSCSDTYSRPDSSGVKRMYLCHVLTGEYTLGKTGMRVPPPKQAALSSSLYDSVVNNVSSPTMFIIFHDTQAYPQYLILFKKK